MGTSVRIVSASEIDLAEHTRFQRAAFAKRFSLLRASTVQSEAYYAWKYRTPAGTARVAQAFAAGKLVGSLSVAPMRFAGPPTATRVWHLCDGCTDPNSLTRGIFTSCWTRLRAAIGEEQPIYGIPNDRSYSPLVRAGMPETGCMRLYLTTRRALRRLAGDDVKSWMRHIGDQAFAGQGLDLFEDETLDWRFRACPIASYRIIELAGGGQRSIAVLRSIGARLRIAFLAGLRLARPEDAGALTELLVQSMASHKETFLLTLSEHPPPWHRHSARIPEVILPRRFPILSVNLDPRPTSFTAAEWDVL